MTIDILPTVAELIGAKLPNNKIDGKSIVNLVKGTSDQSPQEAYYFYYGRQLQAIRSGKWKLHFPHGYRTMAGKPGGTGGIPTAYSQDKIGLSLFNLEKDIGETNDVKDKHPEVLARLQALGQAMREELGDHNQKGTGQREPGSLSKRGPASGRSYDHPVRGTGLATLAACLAVAPQSQRISIPGVAPLLGAAAHQPIYRY